MSHKEVIQKRKSHAFGKDVYLLGRGTDKCHYWLEAPKWDCGWYWGFGYIETYMNDLKPESSRDIISHEHWSGFVGKQEKYDFEKKMPCKSRLYSQYF